MYSMYTEATNHPFCEDITEYRITHKGRDYEIQSSKKEVLRHIQAAIMAEYPSQEKTDIDRFLENVFFDLTSPQEQIEWFGLLPSDLRILDPILSLDITRRIGPKGRVVIGNFHEQHAISIIVDPELHRKLDVFEGVQARVLGQQPRLKHNLPEEVFIASLEKSLNWILFHEIRHVVQIYGIDRNIMSPEYVSSLVKHENIIQTFRHVRNVLGIISTACFGIGFLGTNLNQIDAETLRYFKKIGIWGIYETHFKNPLNNKSVVI